jgi:microcystin degradation protein MlrC
MDKPQGRRLFIARLSYEGNSFGPLPADRAAFERTEWVRGEAAIKRAAGTVWELAALPAFRARHPEWSLIVSRCASAIPSGPIDDALFDAFFSEVMDDLRAALASGPLDAIYLSLHGAAITHTRTHPDLDLLRAIRKQCPDVPVAATFDMHGNLPEAIGPLLTLGASYRTHPHLDMSELTARTLERLVLCVEHGLQTQACLVNTGILLPSINMRTSEGPMRRLQEAAMRMESEPGVLCASVLGGFPYVDALHTGASVMVYTRADQDPDGALARQVAATLAANLRAERAAFFVTLPSASEGIAQALASAEPGLIAVNDSADNPYSGGASDTPAALAALVAANPRVPCVVASFADPALVAQARRIGTDAPFEARIGATHGVQFGSPVVVRVVAQRFTDGEYRGTAGLLGGLDVQCGESVVLTLEQRPNVKIIVTSSVDPAIDPAFYRLHGIDLTQERLLLVKGKNHFRAGAGKLCAQIIDIDAPGPACLDVSVLPFRVLDVSARHGVTS